MTSTGQPSADWLGRGELRLPAGLVLSFQRYALPEAGVIGGAPASLGALPIGLTRDGELLLPLAQRECFWIGLSPDTVQRLALAVGVERDDGTQIDVLSGEAWSASTAKVVDPAGTPRIDGVRRPDGRFDPLLREGAAGLAPQSRRLQILVRRLGGQAEEHAAVIQLVDYATFTARTGLPPPEALDPDAGYKGWLLP
jgi:hypothetical protein